jgi:transposase
MGKKTTGRTRHLIVDTLGLLLVVMVTSASVRDRPDGRRILTRPAARFPSISPVWAAGGYANTVDNSQLAWAEETLGVLLEIVKRSDDVTGRPALPRRWVVERTFGRPARNRRLARDHERLTTNSEAMIKLAMIPLMAIRLAGQTGRWSNAIEREAARRLAVQTQPAT